MMRSYVCQQCRLQLRRPLFAPRYPQLLPGRTIVSFRNKQRSTTQDTLHPSEGTSNGRNAAQDGNQNSLDPRLQYRQAASHNDTPPIDVHEQHHGADTSTSTATPVAQTINDFLDHKTPEGVIAAWKLFDKTYTSQDVSALTDPSFSDVHHLKAGKVFLRLSNFICSELQRRNTEVPTPTQLLFRYEKLGITPHSAWKQAIANVTYQLLLSMAENTGSTIGLQESASTKRPSTEETMIELLSLWRLFFQRYGTYNGQDTLESISSDWINIPEEEVASQNLGKSFGMRLQEFHPAHVTSPELQFSAIVIFNYFSAELSAPSEALSQLRSRNKLFINLITSNLAGAEVHRALSHMDSDPRIKRYLNEDFRSSIADGIDSAPELARKINGLDVSSATPEQRASHMVDFFVSRINRQVRLQANSLQLEQLWIEAEKHYKVSEEKVQIPSEVYNEFLSGFMTLLKPDATVRIWNHMVANGVEPTMDTWLSMLVGCGKARDLTGLNAVWERMIRAGIEPDYRCWSSRIHSLISSRQVSAGLAALDEMGSRWLAIEKAKENSPSKPGKKGSPKAKIVNNRPKPEVGSINSAISAIVGLPTRGKVQSNRMKGMPHELKVTNVHKVLQWAGNFDIKPDTRTYNALISLYLDGNDYATAFKLIRQMENEKIEGDIATHSMLLRAAFDNQKFDGLSHQEQADRIVTIFVELEQGGIKPNGFLYQTAVDRLLKQYSNVIGAQAVVEQMISRGFSPNPQIFTSLVTHYFQQTPPAIKEVDSLVALLFGPPAQPTDMMLFDRIIEGYARNDRTASMMTVLTKMGAQGKKPGYRALSQVVESLYRQGDWERARSVIRDVQLGEGIAKTGPMTSHNVDRSRFFRDVKDLCPELLETFAGENMKAPIRRNEEADSEARYIAQSASNADLASASQVSNDQQQQQQQQNQQQQQSFGKFSFHEQPDDSHSNGLAPYQQSPFGQVDQAPYNQSPFGQVEQAPYQEQSYDYSPFEQEQASNQQAPYGQPIDQQTIDIDEQFMNAEHASYLSDEPEAPQQRWETNEQARKQN